eukprot:7769873-Alexandrium_andersonii.AAC.1
MATFTGRGPVRAGRTSRAHVELSSGVPAALAQSSHAEPPRRPLSADRAEPSSGADAGATWRLERSSSGGP